MLTHSQIVEKYRRLFSDNFDGLEVGDGWLPIVDAFCSAIDFYLRRPTVADSPVKIVQVKEKFGELRIYVDQSTPAVNACITFAELMSAQTCEVCGNKGQLRSGRWLVTRCDDHYTQE